MNDIKLMKAIIGFKMVLMRDIIKIHKRIY